MQKINCIYFFLLIEKQFLAGNLKNKLKEKRKTFSALGTLSAKFDELTIFSDRFELKN